MSAPRLTIKHLAFTGAVAPPAELEFNNGCNLIWGASNTGKSFTLEAINFMLGSSDPLSDEAQVRGYETLWLGFTIEGVRDFTVSRAAVGGAFALYEGLIKANSLHSPVRILSQKHDQKNDDTLSNFLLDQLGFSGKILAKNAHGETNNLSFRHLAKVILADETQILSKHSPIEKGDRTDKPLEHSVFRFLVTGLDDSAIIPVENPKKTTASKATKLEILDEMIADMNVRLTAEYPVVEELDDQYARITVAIETIQAKFDTAQISIQELLDEKQRLATDIPKVGERLDEIEIHLSRFAQLEAVYVSDIERLESLEEAGFLVSLGGGRECPLCGAEPEAQMHRQGLADAQQIRVAALAEINKIQLLRGDLDKTVTDLGVERRRLQSELPKLQEQLVRIEARISDALPKVDEGQRTLSEMLALRDKIKLGLSLRDQKSELLSKRDEVKKIKSVSKGDKPNLNLSGSVGHEFGKVVSEVLSAWGFPGDRDVVFDLKTYDLSIDGKPRINNGKGVRAITHAAFKIALLIYCHRKKLPHPGFIILDTPLLTYRDPIRSRHGALRPDEKALALTTLKQNFFEHLYSIREIGQFIIFENIDPPENIATLAKVENFLGEFAGSDERMGLFPSITSV